MELTPEVIKDLIEKNGKPSVEFTNEINAEVDNFVYANKRRPTIDEMKYIYASIFTNLIKVEV